MFNIKSNFENLSAQLDHLLRTEDQEDSNMSDPLTYLANTALASIYVSNAEMYTYCQLSNCELVEIGGQFTLLEAGSLSTYTPTGSRTPIELTKKGRAESPKRFTPLASAQIINFVDKHPRRYLFYVDDNNYLRDVYWDSGKWVCGSLHLSIGLNCAPYSKLAAVKYTNSRQADFVFLYYQDCDDSGDLQICGLDHAGWTCGKPPLCDPPLWGTSITAVPAEPGIELASDISDPVVFFQQTSLELSSSQDDGTSDYKFYAIRDKTQTLSSHAYVAAVDDKTNCWVFYTSDGNDIHRARIGSDGVLTGPVCIGLDRKPIPNSPMAAVITSGIPEQIVLFYILHDMENHVDAPHSGTHTSSSHSRTQHGSSHSQIHTITSHSRGPALLHPRNASTSDKTNSKTDVYATTLTRISLDSWSASPGKSLMDH